jgi:hypothetical protein
MIKLKHKFVEFIPEDLEYGVIYVSIEYCTAVHQCACGCNNKVVTPFSKKDWKLSFDGESISLSPSIGNWSFECQSHYWVKNGHVDWADKWNSSRIEENREKDKRNKVSGITNWPNSLMKFLNNKILNYLNLWKI